MATISYKKNSQERATGSSASCSNYNENEMAKISFLNFFRDERPKISTKSICGFALALFAIAIGGWMLFSGHASSREAQILLPGNSAAQSAAAPSSTFSTTGHNLAEVADQISAQLDQAISRWETENGEFDEEMRDRLAVDLSNLERRVARKNVEDRSTITATPFVERPTIHKQIVVTPTITAEAKMVTPTIFEAKTVTVTNTFNMPKVTVTPTVTSTVVKGPVTIIHQCEFTPVSVHHQKITPTLTAKPVMVTPTITKTVTVTPTVTAKAIRAIPTITERPFVVTPTSYAKLVTVTPKVKLPTLVITHTFYNYDCYEDHVEPTDEELEEERRQLKLREQHQKDFPGENICWD